MRECSQLRYGLVALILTSACADTPTSPLPLQLDSNSYQFQWKSSASCQNVTPSPPTSASTSLGAYDAGSYLYFSQIGFLTGNTTSFGVHIDSIDRTGAVGGIGSFVDDSVPVRLLLEASASITHV